MQFTPAGSIHCDPCIAAASVHYGNKYLVVLVLLKFSSVQEPMIFSKLGTELPVQFTPCEDQNRKFSSVPVLNLVQSLKKPKKAHGS